MPFVIIVWSLKIKSRNLPYQSLDSCFCNTVMDKSITLYYTMITLKVEEYNPITPDFYNDLISKLQFHRLTCPCGQAGCLCVHGYYDRYVKVSEDKLRFRICRVICESCGHTHALLLSSFVPYSQHSLSTQVDIISAYEAQMPQASVMEANNSITESNYRYIIRQYLHHWKEKLLSEKTTLSPSDSLVLQCFKICKRQFMQIRRISNLLFADTT